MSRLIVIILHAISVNIHTNQRRWQRRRCWQPGNKVNEENNNNMTTNTPTNKTASIEGE
jgi:hypothetical protein